MSEVNRFPSIPTKILLPIDFSPSSQAALDMAADLAQLFPAELHLLNVIPEFPTTTIPDFIPEADFLKDARTHPEPIRRSAMRPLRPKESSRLPVSK